MPDLTVNSPDHSDSDVQVFTHVQMTSPASNMRFEFNVVYDPNTAGGLESYLLNHNNFTGISLVSLATTIHQGICCLLYTSPSPRDATLSRMPSSA